MKETKEITIVSGGFDPLHTGHVQMFFDAKERFPASILIVGINSDEWLQRKKGYFLLPFDTRQFIISALRMVDHAIGFDDSDNTAIDLIRKVQNEYGEGCRYVFANGGDRKIGNVPEVEATYEYPVEFAYGIGGGKVQSSSVLVDRIRQSNV